MLNRVGDTAQHTLATQLMLNAQSRTRAVQIQVSSGKVAQRFSGLAADAGRLTSAKDSLLQLQQFRSNNEVVLGRLEVMEDSVASLHEIGIRIRNLLIQRLDSASAVPGVVTPEAQNLLQQTVAELNVEFGGRYLFSGSRTDTPPVALDPGFTGFGTPDTSYYQGDTVQLSVRADIDVEVAYSTTADRTGFQELIGGLRAVIEGDAIDDRPLLVSALDMIDAALPRVADYRAEFGAHGTTLERINVGHSDAELYLERQVSDIENVDIAEAITRMTQDQIVVESSMAMMARLSQVSLVDFL